METSVTDTIHSLIGVKPILDDILVEITEPLRLHLRKSVEGEARRISQGNNVQQPTTLPKFILITGRPGCGKRSLVSAIVNELRRGYHRRKVADIFYKDKNVKFLDWNEAPWDFQLHEYFLDMMAEAKSHEDGRDFTVIFFERFETICPSERTHRGPAEDELIRTMKREIPSCPAGVVLLVAATSYPELVDPEIMGIMDIRYDIPQYDETTKKDILRNFFEIECVGISEPHLDFIITTMGSRSPRSLKSIAIEASGNARIRTNEHLNLADMKRERVEIERQDLAWLMPLEQDEVNENED